MIDSGLVTTPSEFWIVRWGDATNLTVMRKDYVLTWDDKIVEEWYPIGDEQYITIEKEDSVITPIKQIFLEELVKESNVVTCPTVTTTVVVDESKNVNWSYTVSDF